MKYNNLHIILFILGTTILSSCSDWFDISPKTDVKAEELFETENGFQSALAGIYVSMTTTDSYGTNFTFGQLDKMVQYYDWMPDNESDPAVIFQYQTENSTYNSKSVLANMWAKAYNIIANANNLISWLDKNGEHVISTEETRNMLRGEALAIRALIHFDLLRCWGPMYRSDSTALSIPYRQIADASRQPLLPANEVVTHIMSDLSQARQLLSYEKGKTLLDNNRQFRMNYYAITALMARVCNYRNDKGSAINYASEVINDCGLGLMDNARNSPAMMDETIFGINMYQMDDNLKELFAEGPTFNNQLFCTLTKLADIFETRGVGTNDMRAKTGQGFLEYNETNEAISRKYIKNDEGLIPIIRLPEMYYIMCECLPLDQAASYINTVRQKRGILRSNDYIFSTDQQRIDALNLEYRKEFYAEGQYFYFLKLHEMTTFLNCPISSGMSKTQYIFPLPDDEIEYGWTNNSTENEENANTTI